MSTAKALLVACPNCKAKVRRDQLVEQEAQHPTGQGDGLRRVVIETRCVRCVGSER